VNKDFSKPRK